MVSIDRNKDLLAIRSSSCTFTASMLKAESHRVGSQEQLRISWYVAVTNSATLSHFMVTLNFLTFFGWQHLQDGTKVSLPSVATTDEPHTPLQPVALCFFKETHFPLSAVSCSKYCLPRSSTEHTSGTSLVGMQSGQHPSVLFCATYPSGHSWHTGVLICTWALRLFGAQGFSTWTQE